MANLTLRLVKGSPLTYAEVDDNFIALNDATGHFKNALINGNFDVWQRGTSFTVSGYGPDRWIVQESDGIGTTTRQTFTLGQTDVPGEPRYFLRHDRTGAATATLDGVIIQHIESARTFAGQEITWSFWAKVASGTKALTPRIVQNFGTGGSPSASITKDASPITITTSWQKFVVTMTLDSISGKTLGSNDDDYLSIRLVEVSPFTTFTLDFAQAQVEKGDEATEFERRPFQTELALCQRYYEKTFNTDDDPGTTGGGLFRRIYTTVSINHELLWQFKVVKRVVPTITIYSPSTGNTGVMFVDTADRAANTAFVNQSHASINLTAGLSASSPNQEVRAHITADAEL